MKLFSALVVLLASTSSFAAEPREYSVLEAQALFAIKSMPTNPYAARRLCIYLGQAAVGVIASGPNLLVERGLLEDFPSSEEKLDGRAPSPISLDMPQSAAELNLLEKIGPSEFYETTGKVEGHAADLCVFENKPVLE